MDNNKTFTLPFAVGLCICGADAHAALPSLLLVAEGEEDKVWRLQYKYGPLLRFKNRAR